MLLDCSIGEIAVVNQGGNKKSKLVKNFKRYLISEVQTSGECAALGRRNGGP